MFYAVGEPALTKNPAKVIRDQRGARTHDPEIKSLIIPASLRNRQST